VLPSANFTYNFTSSKKLTADYNTNVNEPGITQLQPIVDNSNPLNIFVGNPDLKPEYSHTLRTRFFSFNPTTFSNFFANLNVTYTSNKITNEQTITDELVTISTPINVEQDYRVQSFLNYGSRFPNLGIQYSLSPSFTYNRGITFINGTENNQDLYVSRMRLRVSNLNTDKLNVSLSGSVAYTSTQFSIAKSQDRDFLQHEYGVEMDWQLPAKFSLNTELDYQIYSGLGDGFDQDIPIWQASVSRFFLPGNKLQLSVVMMDILNENRGVSRTNTINYTLDEEVNALGRYFQVRLTYNVKGFANDDTKKIRRFR